MSSSIKNKSKENSQTYVTSSSSYGAISSLRSYQKRKQSQNVYKPTPQMSVPKLINNDMNESIPLLRSRQDINTDGSNGNLICLSCRNEGCSSIILGGIGCFISDENLEE
ncbi:hypothetical protein G9A89_001024 [Geosiphon pyriformis]|nr:hypothetical protein G9A89_001024 [Geosiphon pyriformis]